MLYLSIVHLCVSAPSLELSRQDKSTVRSVSGDKLEVGLLDLIRFPSLNVSVFFSLAWDIPFPANF